MKHVPAIAFLQTSQNLPQRQRPFLVSTNKRRVGQLENPVHVFLLCTFQNVSTQGGIRDKALVFLFLPSNPGPPSKKLIPIQQTLLSPPPETTENTKDAKVSCILNTFYSFKTCTSTYPMKQQEEKAPRSNKKKEWLLTAEKEVTAPDLIWFFAFLQKNC